MDEPTSIASFAEFEQAFGGLWIESNLGYAVRDFFLNGGSQAIIVRVNHGAAGTVSEADFIGPGKEAANEGLFTLKKVDLFNLLCIPPYNPQGNVDTAVLAAAAKLCEDLKDFVLVHGVLSGPKCLSSVAAAARVSYVLCSRPAGVDWFGALSGRPVDFSIFETPFLL